MHPDFRCNHRDEYEEKNMFYDTLLLLRIQINQCGANICFQFADTVKYCSWSTQYRKKCTFICSATFARRKSDIRNPSRKVQTWTQGTELAGYRMKLRNIYKALEIGMTNRLICPIVSFGMHPEEA